MTGNLADRGVVVLTKADKSELDWWCAHYKGNVAYLATRIKQLVENPEDEQFKEFFYKHFQATVNDFLKSMYPVLDVNTGEMMPWDKTVHYGLASDDEVGPVDGEN